MMGNKNTPLASRIYLFLSLAVVIGFYAYGLIYLQGYRFLGGFHTLRPEEAYYLVCFTFAGLFCCISLFLYFIHADMNATLRSIAKLALEHKYYHYVVLAAAFSGMLFAGFVLFKTIPITDDENCYRFVAGTLLSGNLTNAIPKYANLFSFQFMMFSHDSWFCQYTIGHPLFLAIGRLLGIEYLVVPLAATGSLFIIHKLVRDHVSSVSANLTITLIALSPTFLLTSGTQLGYATALLCSLLLIWAWDRYFLRGSFVWIVLFAIASTLLLLNRTHSWFSLGAVLGLASFYMGWRKGLRIHFGRILLLACAAGASLAVFMWINYRQTGDPFVWTQMDFLLQWGQSDGIGFGHRSPLWGIHTFPKALSNLFIGTMRQSAWMFGWPFSYCFIFFCGRRGPQYFALSWFAVFQVSSMPYWDPGICLLGVMHQYEMIPALALLTSEGILRLDKTARQWIVSERAKSLVPGLVASLQVTALLIFWIPVIFSLHSMVNVAGKTYFMLDAHDVHHAVVFMPYVVADGYSTQKAWVYDAGLEGPELDKLDRIYVKTDNETDMETFLEDYPERSAWRIAYTEKSVTLLQKHVSKGQWTTVDMR